MEYLDDAEYEKEQQDDKAVELAKQALADTCHNLERSANANALQRKARRKVSACFGGAFSLAEASDVDKSMDYSFLATINPEEIASQWDSDSIQAFFVSLW